MKNAPLLIVFGGLLIAGSSALTTRLLQASGWSKQYTVATPSKFSVTAKPPLAHDELPKITVPADYDHCFDCSELARLVAWSLDNEPTKWDFDGYHLAKGSDVTIWMANGVGFVRLEEGGPNGVETGAFGADMKVTHDKELIWRAFSRWRKPRDDKAAANAKDSFR